MPSEPNNSSEPDDNRKYLSPNIIHGPRRHEHINNKSAKGAGVYLTLAEITG